MLPFSMTTELHSWQIKAVEKLAPLKVGGLFMEMGVGKALQLDAGVLTPIGWVKMGDIAVGDRVIGGDGKPTEVTGVYPQGEQEIFEVTFSDGGQAHCTEDHLWRVTTPLRKTRGYSWHVMTLGEIVASGLKHVNGNRKYQIPLVKPVEFESNGDLTVDPYLLGVLLGDGSLRATGGPMLTTADDEILHEVVKRLPEDMRVHKRSAMMYGLSGTIHRKNPLMDRMRALGLTGKKSEAKFIPPQYLMAPVDARILLLQGLMDTDGYPTGVGSEFVTVSPQLAADMQFLVRSLGGLVNIALKTPWYTYKGERRQGQLAYRFHIRFPNGIQPFMLSRKRVALRTKYPLTRSVESVVSVGFKPAQCIKVAAKNGLFVTDDFVVTHNTISAIELVHRRMEKIDRVIWFTPVSLKDNVRYEILKHTDCNESDIYLFDTKTSYETVPRDKRWYIVGIESLSSSDRVTYALYELITKDTCVILDESSYIKSEKTKRTERATILSATARYRMILTGTPISNGIGDLWSQMKFLSPKILKYQSFDTFARNHLDFDNDDPNRVTGIRGQEYITQCVEPFVFQVTKAEALSLPEKKYYERTCMLTHEQEMAYQQAKDEMLTMVETRKNFGKSYFFRLVVALQQIVSGFWNKRVISDPPKDDDPFELLTFPDYRLDTLLDTVREFPDDDKVIIWAKYLYDTNRIVAALAERYGDDAVAVFTGKVPQIARPREIAKFRGPARFLVATQSAGGHGLTLTEAHSVVFYNNNWKYSERIQAEDRVHRLGQTETVRYYDIFVPDTIDDKIRDALERKKGIAAEFHDGVKRAQDKKEYVRNYINNL